MADDDTDDDALFNEFLDKHGPEKVKTWLTEMLAAGDLKIPSKPNDPPTPPKDQQPTGALADFLAAERAEMKADLREARGMLEKIRDLLTPEQKASLLPPPEPKSGGDPPSPKAKEPSKPSKESEPAPKRRLFRKL